MIHNPVIPGFNPDPSILFDGSRFVIAVSTFEYYPGVALYASKDLSSWEYAGSALTEDNGFSLAGVRSSSGIYAPAIRFHEGRYYLATTVKNGMGNIIVHADSPAGPWSEPLPVYPTGIDPSLTFLPDGSCFYVQNGPGGIYGAYIDPAGGHLQEDLRLICPGQTGYATEAPHIYCRDGMYYLVFAEGGTEYGHHEAVGRSASIYGPYELRPESILSHTARKNHEVQATGHADLLQLPDGRWIAVFLAIRMPGKPLLHHLGRETFMAEVSWEDGWPVIGDGGKVELEMESPVETVRRRPFSFSSSCDIDASPLLRLRARHRDYYDMEGGELALHGGEGLSEPLGEPAALLMRQEDFDISFSAVLRTDATLSGRAGVTVFYSCDYHADILCERTDGGIAISLRRHIHDLEAVQGRIILPGRSSVRLEMKADRERYTFYADGHSIGSASTASFATEGTMYMTFTGTLVGIFAEGGDARFILPFGFTG